MKKPVARPRIGKRIASALGAMLIAIALPLAAAEPAAAVTDRCTAGVIFIGVRGTDATAGSSPSGSNVWLSGGHGSEVEPVRAKFENMLGSYLWSASLNYPASGGASYPSSFQTGVDRLVAELNLITACQFDPPIVIVGHSQGADVVANALASDSLSSAARAQVKAAILYGDTGWRPYKNFNAPGSPTSGAGILPRAGEVHDRLESRYYVYGWGYMSVEPGYFSKIRSYCFLNDWACQGAGSDAVHNSYDTIAQQAFEWAQYMTANTN